MPIKSEPITVIISRRDSLNAWEAFSQKDEVLVKIEYLLISQSEREQISGLITWFTMPSKNTLTPPARIKMTVVSWFALYPAVTLIFLAIWAFACRPPFTY